METIKVLLIDDDKTQELIIRALFKECSGKNFELEWCYHYEKAKDAIRKKEHDIYLIDYQLDKGLGTDLIRDINEEGLNVPMILLTSDGSLDSDLEALNAGALDYLVKSEINQFVLERSIRYALETNKYISKLDESNKALDQFAYLVSHDLKGPLRGILNYSEFVLEDEVDKLKEDSAQFLERIKVLSKKMFHLIDTIYRYSKVTKIDQVNEIVDLQILLDGILERLELDLKEKNVTIQVNEKLPSIPFNKVWGGEIFYNLISNAIKYNSKKSPSIEIGFNETAKKVGNLQIYIRDNGDGIAEKDFEKIFLMFQKAHQLDLHDGIESTGAGLTFVKKIVEKMNGEVWLESKIGEGTTFYLELPNS